MPDVTKPGATMFPVSGTDHADCLVPGPFAKHCSESQVLQSHEIPVKIRRFLSLSSIEQMGFV